MPKKWRGKRSKEKTPEETQARVRKNIDKCMRVGKQLHFKKGYWYKKWKAGMRRYLDSLEEQAK